jgi:DNA-binding NarL/FixJ family response regulator
MAFRILLADDHEVVRRGLCAILQDKTEWEVCGEAKDGIDAVEKAKRLKPDAVIIDIGMPNLNGLDATRQIVDALPQTKVLVLTLYESDDMIQQVLNAGARGFLLKSDAGRNLVAAVEALRRSGTYFTSKVAEMVRDGYLKKNTEPVLLASKRTRLTFRERQLVQLLAEGKSTRQAALALGMSVKTAETHRSNVMRKLQLHSISELVLYAVRNSIVQIAQAQN